MLGLFLGNIKSIISQILTRHVEYPVIAFFLRKNKSTFLIFQSFFPYAATSQIQLQCIFNHLSLNRRDMKKNVDCYTNRNAELSSLGAKGALDRRESIMSDGRSRRDFSSLQ